MSSSIKPHPYAPFKQLARSFSAKNVHPWLRSPFLATMYLWRRAFGIDAAEQRIEADIAASRDAFWHDDWIFDTLFYPEISASLIMEQDAESRPDVKAAKLVHAAVEFRRRLLAGLLAPDTEAGLTLDMDRYRNFFSRMTLSTYANGKITHRITDVPASDYVVCAIDRRYYKLRVIENGETVSYQEIFNRLSQCLARARAAVDDFSDEPAPLGLLTTLSSKDSLGILEGLYASQAATVATLNGALFVVAIDIHAQPSSLEKVFRSIHCENFANRDYRRSFQIVVSGNGRAGILVNPHAGIGGTIMARFCSEMFRASQELPSPSVGSAPREVAEPIPLAAPVDHAQQVLLRQLHTQIHRKIYRDDQIATFRIDAGGGKAFRERGWSPDAAFHCALNLAYYRTYGRSPVVGNFINLRCVKHGDIWRYNASSPEMTTFTQRPDGPTMARAMAVHRQLVKQHKLADDDFYLGAMALKRMVNDRDVPFLSFVGLMMILSLFVRDFGKRFMHPDVWVSGIPALPGLEIVGRGSVTMSFLDKDSIGGHYMIFDDHIKVCLLTSDSDKGRQFHGGAFARALAACLTEILTPGF